MSSLTTVEAAIAAMRFFSTPEQQIDFAKKLQKIGRDLEQRASAELREQQGDDEGRDVITTTSSSDEF
jgi:hypothetical protein